MKFNFCYNCGCKLASKYKFCPQCGVEIPRESNLDVEKQVDDFFNELENATKEDRDKFFELLEQDLKKKKGGTHT